MDTAIPLLSIMVRTYRQKINREIEDFSNAIVIRPNRYIYIYRERERTLCLSKAECTFFSGTHKTLSSIDHILGYTISFKI